MSDFDDEPTPSAGVDDDGWDDEPEPTPRRRSNRKAAASSDEGDVAVDDGADDGADEAPAAARKRRPPADDDWDDDWDEDDRGGRRDLTLVYAVVAAAIVIVLAVVLTQDKDPETTTPPTGAPVATTQAALPDKNWQGPVGDAVGENGKDAQARVASAPGVYIWTDFQGWHVRSNGTEPVVVTVTAPQVRVKETDDYNDDNEDSSAEFTAEAQATLQPGSGETGAGFDLGNSETATFAITVNGQNVPKEQIFLGGSDTGVADESPVTFTKA